MQIHIENLSINLTPPQIIGLGAIIKGKASEEVARPENCDIPAIGEKWPGTEAVYAGTALSSDERGLVHLIVWPDRSERLNYADGVKWAEQVQPDMNSHLPTRYQSIPLYERLQDQFNQDYYHWTLTKTKVGNAAFLQYFSYGLQHNNTLSSLNLVRAVSEIPL